MSSFLVQRLWVRVLAPGFIWTALGAHGQGLELSVQPSAASVLVGQSLTYTINLTNRTGFTLGNVWVTNSFSAPVGVGAVSFTLGNGINYTGSAFTNSSMVVLD